MPSLAAYLELTDAQARAQWGRIDRRIPSKKQEPYTSVEVILCCALFRIIDPHRFGGRNIDHVPDEITRLADLFVRSPASITSKMLNLDGSRANAAANEVLFFDAMAADPAHFSALYERVLIAARHMGITPERLPDFVERDPGGGIVLLGQDHLPQQPLVEAVELLAAKIRARQLAASDAQTARIAEQTIRLGQHRFAKQVLANYKHQCGFCSFAPRSLPRKRLLIASHIKPWAVCNDAERLDASNGIAACPMHDAAFDAGLITINGGLRVHRASRLQQSVRVDPGVDHNFGRSLRRTLRTPERAAPESLYLDWHQQHVFADVL
ncbi:HNH endonuclease [Candidatus Poriferisodalis sp.]|uniref:HNH endonuclease n=1 Tax=Candidatus Poriferisodalis sp. TaxID=3101277 RepID=UPI003B5C2692